jgi:DNA-binding NarL/FixJ family response regulator
VGGAIAADVVLMDLRMPGTGGIEAILTKLHVHDRAAAAERAREAGLARDDR